MTVFGGNIILASDINSLQTQITSLNNQQWATVRATGDLTRPSTTTLADDPDMQFAVEANTVYEVLFDIYYAGLDAADFKTAWSVPSGAGGLKWVLGASSTAAANANADDVNMRVGVHGFATPINYGCPRNGTNQQHFQEGAILTVGSTAGSVILQWAQVTSNATGSTRNASSYVKYRKILS